jgi:single-strand DNA-binding protein
MGCVNKVILVGNLGRDAELRYTPGGAAVANFSVATTETWNDKAGQRQERTEWHRIDLWGKQAESLSEYLVKGKQVYVEGRLQTDEFTDKEGTKRKSTKVRADRIVLLSAQANPKYVSDEDIGSGLEPTREVATVPSSGASSSPLIDDDIPF